MAAPGGPLSYSQRTMLLKKWKLADIGQPLDVVGKDKSITDSCQLLAGLVLKSRLECSLYHKNNFVERQRRCVTVTEWGKTKNSPKSCLNQDKNMGDCCFFTYYRFSPCYALVPPRKKLKYQILEPPPIPDHSWSRANLCFLKPLSNYLTQVQIL